ncbi:MAG: phospholipid carrier-dependent glycosyltransferase [Gammaproteobacteria bacterium]|nr:phospholipid carrier-dependent glycosyltransferase [Gammaproteobacteria bacterium]
MQRILHNPWVWIGLGAILLLSAILGRPILAIDETRYISVAWEMWSSGEYILPQKNGEPYHHKPPLLFWLMSLSWLIFGVSEWAARIPNALVSLAILLMVQRVFIQIWPDHKAQAWLAPAVMLGSLFWLAYATLAMFDMMLALWTLVAIHFVLQAALRGGLTPWLLTGVALGLGLLTKGPVILLHVLPVALLAPLWTPQRPASWLRWYASILMAIAIAAAIILAWALPAADRGGEAFRQAIFWGQTADRMVKSMAHEAVWWWYLPKIPLLLFPWFFWPPFWQALRRETKPRSDWGIRFLLFWLIPVFIAFTLISGKLIHYLLPLLPAAVLLISRVLATADRKERRYYQLPVALVITLVGIFMLIAPQLQPKYNWPVWVLDLPLATGPLLLAIAALAFFLRGNSLIRMALVSWAMMLILNITLVPVAATAYDVRPMAQMIARYQQQNIPVAYRETYHNQFPFSGRLQKPLILLGHKRAVLNEWVRRNPTGMIITPTRQSKDWPEGQAPLFFTPYRGKWMGIWQADSFPFAPINKLKQE